MVTIEIKQKLIKDINFELEKYKIFKLDEKNLQNILDKFIEGCKFDKLGFQEYLINILKKQYIKIRPTECTCIEEFDDKFYDYKYEIQKWLDSIKKIDKNSPYFFDGLKSFINASTKINNLYQNPDYDFLIQFGFLTGRIHNIIEEFYYYFTFYTEK